MHSFGPEKLVKQWPALPKRLDTRGSYQLGGAINAIDGKLASAYQREGNPAEAAF